MKNRVKLLNDVEEKVKQWCSSPVLEKIIIWGLNLHIYDVEIMNFMINMKFLRKQPYEKKKRPSKKSNIGLKPTKKEFSKLLNDRLDHTARKSKIRDIFVINPNIQISSKVKSLYSYLIETDGTRFFHIDPINYEIYEILTS